MASTAVPHARGRGLRLALRAGTAFTGAFIAVIAGNPQSALAACQGVNTGNVLCDAANQAAGGTLTTTFAGTTVVNVNPGGNINGGTGATATVTAAGDLTFNNNDTTFGISSNANGIQLFNDFGAVTYVGNADVTAANVAATGVRASAGAAGDITITNNATVFGSGTAIFAQHTGTGSVNVTHAGTITSADTGIVAQIANAANAGNATVTANGTIAANNIGISAATSGSGNVTVTTTQNVTGPMGGGIVASVVDGRITVNVAGGTVTGSAAGFLVPGIQADATGTGGATINVSTGASVIGDQFTGIVVNGTNNIINNDGTIRGATGIRASSSTSIVNAGAITGTLGAAVLFTGAGNTLTMQGPLATLTGQATGSGTDTFRFAGTGTNTFDVSQIDTGWTLLDKTGTSNWILTGTGTYAGPVTVNGGTLSVNGDLSSASGVTVNAGGALGGTGTLPSTTINAGGSLAPGNSIGTINISGSLTFVGAGNYVVEVSPASADRTNVTGAPGTATLSGTLRAIGTGGTYTVGTRYTVLNATGGVSGTFGNLAISGNFGVTRPHIEYDLNNVYLVLDQGLITPFLVNGTPNQRAVAGAADAALLAGNAAAPFPALIGLTSPQLNGALDQLSGEVHASTAGALVDESQYMRSAILGRLRQASYGGNAGMAALSMGGPQTSFADEAFESALAYAKSPIVTKAPVKTPQATSDIVFWSQGFGAWGRFNSDGNAAALNRDLAGFVTGFDARFGTWRGGLAAGYTASRNNTDGRGSANVESGHVAAYGGTSVGAFNLRAGGAFAWHTIDTDRTIAFPGFFDRATAHYEGRTGQIFGEAGYGLAFGKIAVEPFAGAAFVHLDTDAASERATAAGLNIAATTFEVGYSTLGVRAASLVPLDNGMVLIPRASAAWQHAFGNVTPAAALAFQTSGTGFVVSGVPIARDALLGEAGLDLAINSHATVGVSYTGQISSNVTDHAARGKFSWRF